MWFDDEEASGRRLLKGKRGRRAALNVNARVAASKSKGRIEGLPYLVVTLVLALAVGLWFSVREIGRLLFSQNPVYTIARVDIDSDSVVVRDFIRGKKNIREGENLFCFSIGAVRDEFLRSAPHFKSMQITRQLPDALAIKVVERVPVAKVGRKGGFVVDREGVVFGSRASEDDLPLIVGYKGPLLKPGDRLAGLARDAVEILLAGEKSMLSRDVQIAAIDITGGFAGRENDVLLHLDGNATAILWWERDAREGVSPEADLQNRLEFLHAVVKKTRQDNRQLRRVNLSLESYRKNCPVTFWN